MKLKEYIKTLQEIAEKHPNVEVIYSADEEGNYFGIVYHTPSLGSYYNGEFINDDGSEEFKEEYKINAICVN